MLDTELSPSHFTHYDKNILHRFRDARTEKKLFQLNERVDSLVNYTNSMLTFVNYRRESLLYLEKIGNELHRLVYGLEKLTNGQLSTAIIPARDSAKHIQNIIKTKCRFIYHEVLHPTPTTLQTQDEILFANFPSENWQLICDEITDRPSFMKGALYTIINLQDLCTCGILTQEGRFLYESMRSCDSPDTEVDLHFSYMRALVSYDNHITAQDSKRYAIKPYPFQAPDLQYYEHMPYMTSNGTLHLRTRRHAPSTNTHQQAIAVQQFPSQRQCTRWKHRNPSMLVQYSQPPLMLNNSKMTLRCQ